MTNTNEATAVSHQCTNEKGVAIGGYDVICYASDNRAVRGSAQHSSLHDGATFYFASPENKKQFDTEPLKYLPAYGGHCAFAMAVGNGKVPCDPQTFKFHNGRLYFFFNDYYEGAPFNTIVPWNADEEKLITKADANWRELV